MIHACIRYFILFLPSLGLATRGSDDKESIRRAADAPYHVHAAAPPCAEAERRWVSSADGDSSMPSESRQLSPAAWRPLALATSIPAGRWGN